MKNGETWIESCLAGIRKQTLFNQIEILILDSGSTDNTLPILSQYPFKLIHINGAEFNHGSTRNIGVREAKGEYVLLTVQDARAAGKDWMERMVNVFKNDPEVSAVCGGQAVPHDSDKNPVDWYRPISALQVQKFQYSNNSFEKLSPEEKQFACRWDNVNAMYKRSELLEIPFQHLVFGEDMAWAKDALQSNRKIAYDSGAFVYHYHHETEDYIFKRLLTTWYFRYRHFGSLPPKDVLNFKKKLRIFKLLVFHSGKLSLGQQSYWWKYNMMRWKVRMKVFSMFHEALTKGESQLDQLHFQYCGIAPQHTARQKQGAQIN